MDFLTHFIDIHLSLELEDTEALACWIVLMSEAVRQNVVRQKLIKITSKQIVQLEKLVSDVLISENRSTNNVKEIAYGIFSSIEGAYRLPLLAPQKFPHGFAAKTVKQMAYGIIKLQKEIEGSNSS